MIGVKTISHTSYETPDLEKQIEYHADVLGLTLIAREQDAVYLAGRCAPINSRTKGLL